MIFLVLKCVSASLRGKLTRWMLEPKTGVFIGHLSALVRDKLWELVCATLNNSTGLLPTQATCEQELTNHSVSDTSRTVIDIESLLLIRV